MPKFILLDSVSSSGKSTIGKYFNGKNFLHFQIDNYFNDKRLNYEKLFKNIKNSYGETEKIYLNEPVKYMVKDAIESNKNIIFDHVSQKEIIDIMGNRKLYIIIIFTNIKNLARNIELRRKEGDRRGIFVFNQFADRYIKCSDNSSKKIEIVNREKFKKILLKYFKYEFNSESDLINFSNDVFKKMKIKDDDDHYVKLRPEYICDYLLITTNKTKDDLFKELKKIIIE